MRNLIVVVFAVFALALAGPAGARAGEGHGKAGEKHAVELGHGKPIACTSPVRLTEAAEKKPGGALYKGPIPKAAIAMGKMAMGAVQGTDMKSMGKHVPEMPEMKGAHTHHKGLRGGELIMAPNQLHHMEVVYTVECGFQLFMYNAFTEPIRADRFQAFILILPEGGDAFFKVMRFLVPSENGDRLQTKIVYEEYDGPNPKGIFEVELYIKFPKKIQPVMFSLIVGSEVTWD